MIDESFRIYVEQLRGGAVEELHEVFPSDFIGVNDKDLKFVDPVGFEGKAYLADDMLILYLDVSTECILPCKICNEPVRVPIKIKGSYQAIPLTEIKGAIFNFAELLREIILIEAPLLAECHEGVCPERKLLGNFLKAQSEEFVKEEKVVDQKTVGQKTAKEKKTVSQKELSQESLKTAEEDHSRYYPFADLDAYLPKKLDN